MHNGEIRAEILVHLIGSEDLISFVPEKVFNPYEVFTQRATLKNNSEVHLKDDIYQNQSLTRPCYLSRPDTRLPMMYIDDCLRWVYFQLLIQFVAFKNNYLLRSPRITIEEGFIQMTRQMSSLLFGGQNLFNSLPR